ncbi:GerAB/ArcD/ProY family transporter [Fictibacillus phosphorivorans]|uniref:GerAB/ArcD/ProY family transporter n=1 Tax=Fictibacillus phosphorivorans TaxID=1221500 RepID=UPI00203A544C|nr:GerAB/ArcD/ProY family transporter [Fictibacillus phosphorivorans]MCM3718428.1 spore germination protein [Fictibacillus phosphorivorans]MCM3776052.1 spore germination protein [Fictibacillus phosphorivorans]
MKVTVKEQFLISPYLAFFIVHSMQIGVGVMGFQRYVATYTEQDSWLTVMMGGAAVHLVIWMMYKMLNKEQGDILSIHETAYGKWIGRLLTILFIIYLIAMGITVLRTFLEVLQVWMFTLMKTWVFTFVYLIAAYHIIAGGFRSVVGVCFLGVVVPFYLNFTFLAPLEFSNVRNLFPILDHSIKDFIVAMKPMTLSYLGFETLLVFYPFFKKPETSQKWFHYGNLFTVVLYFYLMLITLVYYTPDHLRRTIWATISMWKIIRFPFVERFEYIGLATWTIVILPNICLAFWAASRMAKRMFNVTQKKSLIFILVFAMIVSPMFDDRTSIEKLNMMVSQFGFYFNFGYIPLLFFFHYFMSKVRNKA